MFTASPALPTPRPIWLNVLMPLKDKEGKNPLFICPKLHENIMMRSDIFSEF